MIAAAPAPVLLTENERVALRTGKATLIDGVFSWNENAAPAVREPLTDEQIRDVCVDVHMKRDFTTNLEKFVAIARAIEQAHGITGGSNG